jgi:hypothetical protein
MHKFDDNKNYFIFPLLVLTITPSFKSVVPIMVSVGGKYNKENVIMVSV